MRRSAGFALGSILAANLFALSAPADIARAQEASASPAAPAGSPTSLPPIPEGDVAALIKSAGLVESSKTVKELVPGWTKPKLMLVNIDRPDRLTWLQEAVPGVK